MRRWPRLEKWIEKEKASATQYRELLRKSRRLTELGTIDDETDANVWLSPADQGEYDRWKQEQQPTLSWAKRYHSQETQDSKVLEYDRNVFDRTMSYLDESGKYHLKLIKDRQKEAAIWKIGQFALILLLLITLVSWGLTAIGFNSAARSEQESKHNLTTVHYQQASRDFQDGKTDLASYHMVRAMQSVADSDVRYESIRSLLPIYSRSAGRRLIIDSPTTSVCFSPNGQYLATASRDRTARIYDTQSGKKIHAFKHKGQVTSAQFSPNGQYLATASFDGTARIYDAQSGEEIHAFKHDNVVRSPRFSPNGQYLATASGDGTARIYDTQSGKKIHAFKHDSGVGSAHFSPNGQYLATASGGTARIYDTQSGEEIHAFKHGNVVRSAVLAPMVSTWRPQVAMGRRGFMTPKAARRFTPSNTIVASAPPILALMASTWRPQMAMGRRGFMTPKAARRFTPSNTVTVVLSTPPILAQMANIWRPQVAMGRCGFMTL